MTAPQASKTTRIHIAKSLLLFGIDPPPSLNAVRRWCLNGLMINGRLVRLAHLRIGARIFLTEKEITAFIAALTAAGEALPAVASPLAPDDVAVRAGETLALNGS